MRKGSALAKEGTVDVEHKVGGGSHKLVGADAVAPACESLDDLRDIHRRVPIGCGLVHGSLLLFLSSSSLVVVAKTGAFTIS